MFCHHCGNNTPDDSQFCRSCGKSLSRESVPVSTGAVAAAPAPIPRATDVLPHSAPRGASKSNATRWVLLAALLVVVWLAVIASTSHSTPGAPSAIQQIVKQQYTQRIVDGDFVVNALGYRYYRVAVPQGAINVSIEGNFSASGGAGNDVETSFLSDSDFVNWQSGHSVSTFYNSGRATQETFNKQLPAGAGTYYLVFNNKFSVFTAKSIRGVITLHYMN